MHLDSPSQIFLQQEWEHLAGLALSCSLNVSAVAGLLPLKLYSLALIHQVDEQSVQLSLAFFLLRIVWKWPRPPDRGFCFFFLTPPCWHRLRLWQPLPAEGDDLQPSLLHPAWPWVWPWSINNAGRGHVPTAWCTTLAESMPPQCRLDWMYVDMLLPKKENGNLCRLVRTTQMWCFTKWSCLGCLLELFLLNKEVQGRTEIIASP